MLGASTPGYDEWKSGAGWAIDATQRAELATNALGTAIDSHQPIWARMRVELLNRRRWSTRVELANAVFE